MVQANSVFKYFVGDTKAMSMSVFYENTLIPLDLTLCSEIVVNLPNNDGIFVQLKKSLGQVSITAPAVLGQFIATLTETLWPIPNVGPLQSLFVTFTISGAPLTVEFAKGLTVLEVT